MNKLGFGFLRLPKKGEDYDWDEISKMVDAFMAAGGYYYSSSETRLL